MLISYKLNHGRACIAQFEGIGRHARQQATLDVYVRAPLESLDKNIIHVTLEDTSFTLVCMMIKLE